MALRLASIAALATGGVALGHGVVGFANSRNNHAMEVANVSVAQPDALAAAPADGSSAAAVEPAAPPVFTSSMRSWAQPSVASVPTAAAVQQVMPTPSPAPVVQTQTYTVGPGDTLSQIADRFGVNVDVLAAANHLTDANVLTPGVQLRVPDGTANGSIGPSAADQPAPPPTAGPAKSQLQWPAAPHVQLSTAHPPVPAPSATAAPATDLSANSPDAAIRSFYALVAQGEFDRAASLWSQRMQSAYPPAENITSRFAQTQALTVTRADVVQLDASNGRATVAVSLSEVVASQPSTTRHYAGDWYLVRGPAGWLLDQPSLQPS